MDKIRILCLIRGWKINISLNPHVYLKNIRSLGGFGSPKLVNNTTAEYIYIAKLTAIMGFFH